jgi:hypothetical protein
MDTEQIKLRILDTLKGATMPLDTEFVRKSIGIKSWHTTHRLLLELVIEKKVKITKTSKSKSFSLEKDGGNEL